MEKIGIRSGGAGTSEGHTSSSVSSNEKLFGAVRDELDAMKALGVTTEPEATDLTEALALVNELKGKWDSMVELAKKFER